ncbi:MAG: hypothetical protein HYY03_08830, partial [Chloroflexi bacterium]|nr:hypothetical protein [Chloroflexota bacterium]
PYTDDPLLNVDLLDESVGADWGSQDYDAINDAPADARTSPETTYKRGDYQLYAFSFKCSDIESLKQTLSDVQDGERRAAFRYDASDNVTDGIFSMEFGFNRRSRGPDLRPRLVLFTSGDPYGTACDPSTPATSISNVGIHGGSAPGSVAVTWETDVPSDSMVIYREQGMPDWVQVGTPARTRVHGVDVFALDPTTKYEFAVRSSTCNGATTTDTNNGAGYNFFRPPLPEPPTQDYFFHGNPTDEAEKLSWFFPGVKTTSSLSFSTSPPDNTASLQHTTGVANEDFVTNPLTAWWLGDFSGQLRGDFIFSWYWSNAQQGDSEVSITVFADPDLDLDPTAVQPDRIIGRGTIQLHALSPVPSLQTGRVHVEGVVQSQILIQAAASGLTAEDLTVHYDSLLAPSKVAIPTELAPIPEKLPLTGPVPPPSAGASGLNPPPTRSGPASFVDIQHGTCYCVIPGGKPDLRVSAEEIVFSQQKVKGGQVVAIAATVHNDGSADADNVQVRFDDNGTPIGTPTIVSIPAGGLATVSVNWNTKGIKGTRTITVTADPANAIDESNEANNSAATTVSVKGNKVQNGSFEQSSDGEKPDKWKDEGNTHYKPGGSHGQRRVEAESDGSWTSEPIAVEAGKTYGVSVDVTGASGNLVVEQVTTAGAVVASLTQLLPVSTDGIFQTAETFLTVAPGVTEVRIRLAAPLTGVATFDNVWLWEE